MQNLAGYGWVFPFILSLKPSAPSICLINSSLYIYIDPSLCLSNFTPRYLFISPVLATSNLSDSSFTVYSTSVLLLDTKMHSSMYTAIMVTFLWYKYGSNFDFLYFSSVRPFCRCWFHNLLACFRPDTFWAVILHEQSHIHLTFYVPVDMLIWSLSVWYTICVWKIELLGVWWWSRQPLVHVSQ